jgi:hypothetical protein
MFLRPDWKSCPTPSADKKNPTPGRALGIAKKPRNSSHAKKRAVSCNPFFFRGLIVIDALLKLA